LEEFTDEEDWIDELENNSKEQESDDNPAAYLANSCEKDRILFNINKELEKKQFEQAKSLLNENTQMFTQKI
ncbi:26516_t:CDS:2, partial [Gigaspora margarita]